MLQRRTVPARALFISLAALALPVIHALVFTEGSGQYELLLWLAPLVPAFLLSYYRGWLGAATALAGGMAVLSLTQVLSEALGRDIVGWPVLLALVTLYLGLALGIGGLTELLHRAREDAERLAFTDELTGLPNRRYARLFLEKEFEAARRGRKLVLVLFDLDHFKTYNDTHGHAAGDVALQSFADVLSRTTRKMNLSARYGGEEFLSIVSSADLSGALVFVERVREGLAAAPTDNGAVSVSAGVAAFATGMGSVDELLATADKALYRAKADGRNCVRVGEPAADAIAIARSR